MRATPITLTQEASTLPYELAPGIQFEVRSRVGWLTIDRPDAKNALNRAMYASIKDIARSVRADDAVDALVITGESGAFAVGGDLKEMLAMVTGPEPASVLGYEDHLPFEAVRQVPKPTIAVIDGLCMGGGVTLALMCDIRIATSSSTFAIPEAKVGIVDGHLPRLLRDRVPQAVQRLWMYTGRSFTAEDAFRYGLLSELATDREDLDAKVAAVLKQLSGSSLTAIARLKSIFNEAMPLGSMTDANESLLGEEARLHLQQFAERGKRQETPESQPKEGNEQ